MVFRRWGSSMGLVNVRCAGGIWNMFQNLEEMAQWLEQ